MKGGRGERKARERERREGRGEGAARREPMEIFELKIHLRLENLELELSAASFVKTLG